MKTLYISVCSEDWFFGEEGALRFFFADKEAAGQIGLGTTVLDEATVRSS